MEAIIDFANVSSAIIAEQVLSGDGISTTVMPTPSAVRAGCGFCLRLSRKSPAAAVECLENNNVPYSGVFSRTEEQGRNAYIQLNASASIRGEFI
ncbi:MAG: DUF3343 domain-containing protein [Synergistaceae bacterium]|jgi:hypothetical protein|nr:DUF3343 domain-containing protein [Synergistaceae bacterium]